MHTMVDALIHWVHLMAAVVWVGGMITVSIAVQPALKGLKEDSIRLDLYRQIGRKFNRIMWWCWAVLFFSGMAKLWSLRNTPDVFTAPFGRILMVKLLLIAAMVVFSLLHAYAWGPRMISGRLAPSKRMELGRRMAFWGKVNAGLAALIIYCAALLRFNPW